MSLKAVKFDTKMYLNFSNFRGRTSAGGGGTSLGPKTGTSVRWGGIGKIVAGWGGPPQEKTLHRHHGHIMIDQNYHLSGCSDPAMILLKTNPFFFS